MVSSLLRLKVVLAKIYYFCNFLILMELPADVLAQLNGKDLHEVALKVTYRNWRDEVALRTIIPLRVFYGKNEYHKDEQWLLDVWDVEKEVYRTFALKDIVS